MRDGRRHVFRGSGSRPLSVTLGASLPKSAEKPRPAMGSPPRPGYSRYGKCLMCPQDELHWSCTFIMVQKKQELQNDRLCCRRLRVLDRLISSAKSCTVIEVPPASQGDSLLQWPPLTSPFFSFISRSNGNFSPSLPVQWHFSAASNLMRI